MTVIVEVSVMVSVEYKVRWVVDWEEAPSEKAGLGVRTGCRVMNEVVVTNNAVAGGVSPSQEVVPFSSVKEYEPAPEVA